MVLPYKSKFPFNRNTFATMWGSRDDPCPTITSALRGTLDTHASCDLCSEFNEASYAVDLSNDYSIFDAFA